MKLHTHYVAYNFLHTQNIELWKCAKCIATKTAATSTTATTSFAKKESLMSLSEVNTKHGLEHNIICKNEKKEIAAS